MCSLKISWALWKFQTASTIYVANLTDFSKNRATLNVSEILWNYEQGIKMLLTCEFFEIIYHPLTSLS